MPTDTTRMIRARPGLALSVIPFLACCNSPTGPSPGSADRYSLSRIEISCSPADLLVTCTATLVDVPHFGDRSDVTSTATWSASDPNTARIAEGIVTPIRRGDVDVHATYLGRIDYLFPSFRVDPAAPAQRLYFVSGNAVHAQTQTRVPDVRVTIIAGEGVGASTLTTSSGVYRFDRLLIGATLRMRAEKTGFVPAETTVCVPSPFGPAVMECPCRGTPGCLAFQMTPVQ